MGQPGSYRAPTEPPSPLLLPPAARACLRKAAGPAKPPAAPPEGHGAVQGTLPGSPPPTAGGGRAALPAAAAPRWALGEQPRGELPPSPVPPALQGGGPFVCPLQPRGDRPPPGGSRGRRATRSRRLPQRRACPFPSPLPSFPSLLPSFPSSRVRPPALAEGGRAWPGPGGPQPPGVAGQPSPSRAAPPCALGSPGAGSGEGMGWHGSL